MGVNWKAKVLKARLDPFRFEPVSKISQSIRLSPDVVFDRLLFSEIALLSMMCRVTYLPLDHSHGATLLRYEKITCRTIKAVLIYMLTLWISLYSDIVVFRFDDTFNKMMMMTYSDHDKSIFPDDSYPNPRHELTDEWWQRQDDRMLHSKGWRFSTPERGSCRRIQFLVTTV